MRRKPGNWRACTDAETCEANVPTLGGNYQGGEGPLEQRRTSGGNGGVDAAHLPLGMSARGGANSPRVVYASGGRRPRRPRSERFILDMAFQYSSFVAQHVAHRGRD